MIKFSILLRRNPAMTHEQLVTYHRDNHAPLFMSMPVVQAHVRRYVQQHTLDVNLPGLLRPTARRLPRVSRTATSCGQ